MSRTVLTGQALFGSTETERRAYVEENKDIIPLTSDVLDVELPADLVCGPCGEPIVDLQYVLLSGGKWVHAACSGISLS